MAAEFARNYSHQSVELSVGNQNYAPIMPGVGNSALREGLKYLLPSMLTPPTEQQRQFENRYAEESLTPMWSHEPQRHSIQWFARMFNGGVEALQDMGIESYDSFERLTDEKKLEVVGVMEHLTNSIIQQEGKEVLTVHRNRVSLQPETVNRAKEVLYQLQAIEAGLLDTLKPDTLETTTNDAIGKIADAFGIKRTVLASTALATVLAGCSALTPQVVPQPTEGVATKPAIVETVASEPTTTIEINPTATQEVAFEPTQTPSTENPTHEPAVHPPKYEVGAAQEVKDVSIDQFGLAEAYALLPLYKEVTGQDMVKFTGATMEDATTNFIDAMKQFKTEPENAHVRVNTVTQGDNVLSYLENTQENGVLYSFTSEGALAFDQPNLSGPDTHIEVVKLPEGTTPSMRLGADGKWYLFGVNAQGEAVAMFNTYLATVDNLQNQWIDVLNGQLMADWDGGEWVRKIVIKGVVGFCSNNPDVYSNEGVLSCAEVMAVKSPITSKDIEAVKRGEVNLGVVARAVDTSGTFTGVFVEGKVADIRIQENQSRWGDSLDLIIDIPQKDGSIIRLYTKQLYGQGPAQGIFNNKPFLEELEKLQQQGKDLTGPSGGVGLADFSDDIDITADFDMSNLFYGMKTQLDWWRGQRIGFFLSKMQGSYNPDVPGATGTTDAECTIVRKLLDPSLPLGDEDRRWTVPFGWYFLSPEQLELIRAYKGE